jgi:hypothetical protein
MIKGVDQVKRGAWLARLEQFRTNGQTVAKFCDGEKVSVQSYTIGSGGLGRPRLRERLPRTRLAEMSNSLAGSFVPWKQWHGNTPKGGTLTSDARYQSGPCTSRLDGEQADQNVI